MISFLIKFCILPLNYDDENDTYSFKWLTSKTIIHILLFVGSLLSCCLFQFFLVEAYGMDYSAFVGE